MEYNREMIFQPILGFIFLVQWGVLSGSLSGCHTGPDTRLVPVLWSGCPGKILQRFARQPSNEPM